MQISRIVVDTVTLAAHARRGLIIHPAYSQLVIAVTVSAECVVDHEVCTSQCD